MESPKALNHYFSTHERLHNEYESQWSQLLKYKNKRRLATATSVKMNMANLTKVYIP